MLAFNHLTRSGKTRRLRVLALEALRANFDFDDVAIRLVADHSFNTIFRVDADGDRFALRVGGEVRIHPSGVEDIEANWLDTLAESGITAPRNIETARRERWFRARHLAVDGERVCTLFTWIDGVELRTRPSAAAARMSGQLLARLHVQASSLPTLTATTEMARSAIYFGNANLVAEYRSLHGSLFHDAEARVQQELDRIWSGSGHPHFLHGDFGPHNILSWRNSLRPIDFQDMRVGHAVQDLGLSLADMNRSRPDLMQPFLDGYASVTALPELSPQTLGLHAIARSLNIMNLALLAPNSRIAAGLDMHAQRVVDWMQPGTRLV